MNTHGRRALPDSRYARQKQAIAAMNGIAHRLRFESHWRSMGVPMCRIKTADQTTPIVMAPEASKRQRRELRDCPRFCPLFFAEIEARSHEPRTNAHAPL